MKDKRLWNRVHLQVPVFGPGEADAFVEFGSITVSLATTHRYGYLDLGCVCEVSVAANHVSSHLPQLRTIVPEEHGAAIAYS